MPSKINRDLMHALKVLGVLSSSPVLALNTEAVASTAPVVLGTPSKLMANQPSTIGIAPLKVAVSGGFSPTFASLNPSLSQQLKRPIEITSLPIAALALQLQQPKFDLIVTGAPNDFSKTDYMQYLYPDSLTVIAHSPVILWCPNPNIRMRVRLNDTLKSRQIKTLALSPIDSPVGDLVRQAVTLPPHVKLKTAAHSLHAWQMAQQGQVDCAFTMIGLVRPTDQYQFIPHRGVKIIAAIPKTSPNPTAAALLLKLLERPLFRARIQQHGYS